MAHAGSSINGETARCQSPSCRPGAQHHAPRRVSVQKLFVLCRATLQRAINAPGERHVIVGFRFNHAKTSVWSDTPPKVLALCFPSVRVRFDKSDFYVEL